VFLNRKRGKEELQFVKKYVRRILIDLLLYNNIESFKTINEMDLHSVMTLASRHGVGGVLLEVLPEGKSELFRSLFALNEHLADVVFHLPDEPLVNEGVPPSPQAEAVAKPLA